jgi:hypothetical protein
VVHVVVGGMRSQVVVFLLVFGVAAASAQWVLPGSRLVGTGAIGGAYQGTSVSISADGKTAIIGGSSDSVGQGAAWVFTRSDSTWSQQGDKLVGTGSIWGWDYSGMIGPAQGGAVSLSSDGNTAIVGGPTDNGGPDAMTGQVFAVGATWVYTICSLA